MQEKWSMKKVGSYYVIFSQVDGNYAMKVATSTVYVSRYNSTDLTQQWIIT